jgi:hypothetical protein
MFQTELVEKIKTHILCSVKFFSEIPAVYDTVCKNTPFMMQYARTRRL